MKYIKIIDTTSIKENTYKIQIYNNNKLIKEDIIKSNNYQIDLDNNKIYVIKIIPIDNYQLRPITGVISKYKDYYKFYFINCYRVENRNPKIVTFFLNDSNYEGLKIEKGELYLWPNLTQYK